jgi:hypothetical protein
MLKNSEKTFDCKLSAKQMKTGNVLAFSSLLKNTQHLKCPEESVHLEIRRKPKQSVTERETSTPVIDLTHQEDKTPERDVEIVDTKPRAVAQFVEVLGDDEKPDALMHLINHLFCDDKKYAHSKVLVFATLQHIDMLYNYLNSHGKQLNKNFPEIFTIPEGATASVRKRLIDLFKHGILLISPYNFNDTAQQTGELLFSVFIVLSMCLHLRWVRPGYFC